ncbi:MAG: type 4a pilus biogenesis protein PilO [Oscillatoria sp. SIO1A7]|nr:type 4a pilus biogenesis protein PilO [Oscillatoria sp. SIO1A7]
MTDANFSPDGEEEVTPPPPGSVVLGPLVLTPTIQGAVAAVVGIAIAGFLIWKMVLPAMEKRTQLEADIAKTKQEIQQRQNTVSKIDEAKAKQEEARQKRERVITLLPENKVLQTLLLDVNQIVKNRGSQLEGFKPIVNTGNNWILESSGGAAAGTPAKGKPAAGGSAGALKLSQAIEGETVSIELDGRFDRVQDTLRDLERLQQIVLVDKFNLTLDSESQYVEVNRLGNVIGQGEPKIKTKFDLTAVVPVSEEQLAKLAAPPEEKKEEKK